MPTLSARILKLHANGCTNAEIAEANYGALMGPPVSSV